MLFGGGVNDNEDEERALRREIKEELCYDIKDAYFLTRLNDNDTEQAIFTVREPVELSQLELREGAAMKFFSAAEIETAAVGFNFKEILLQYLKRGK